MELMLMEGRGEFSERAASRAASTSLRVSASQASRPSIPQGAAMKLTPKKLLHYTILLHPPVLIHRKKVCCE